MNAVTKQTDTILFLDPTKLADSKFQKARVSDRGNVDELAASMREVGVLEPLLVRPQPTLADGYELVAGHRRKRGAIKAALQVVPVIVREYSDDQVLEIQTIENSQRADVHPLDESDNFAALQKRGKSPAQIADKIGRPTAYVLQRLQLCQLGAETRKALDEERITLALALLIARIPDKKLQEQAVRQVEGNEDSPPVTAREGSEIIRDRFMLRLVDAPFDRESVILVKKAGPCTTCPKRTGTQSELFSDVDSPDLCTDPACYRSKVDAHSAEILEAAKKAGKQVLDDSKAKKVFSQHGEQTEYGSNLVSLEETKWSGARNVKVRELLKGEEVAVTLARNPHTGKIHELVPASTVQKSLLAAERERKKKSKAATGRDSKPDPKDLASAAVLSALVAKIDKAQPMLALRFLLQDQIGFGMKSVLEAAAKRRGINPSVSALMTWAEKAPAGQLLGTLVEVVIGSNDLLSDNSKGLDALCKKLGVDRASIEKKTIELAKSADGDKAKASTKAKPAKKSKAK